MLLPWAMPATAQQAARLTLGGDVIALPGVARVLFAFLVVAALAVGVALALRRFAPKLAGAASLHHDKSLRVLERLHLEGDLRLHLVQTGQGRVLITAHRNSIAVVVLATPERGGDYHEH